MCECGVIGDVVCMCSTRDRVCTKAGYAVSHVLHHVHKCHCNLSLEVKLKWTETCKLKSAKLTQNIHSHIKLIMQLVVSLPTPSEDK